MQLAGEPMKAYYPFFIWLCLILRKALNGVMSFMTEGYTVVTTDSGPLSVSTSATKTAKTYLKKFRELRPEIKTLEDYKKVAPGICVNYLIEGLTPIWEI